MTRRSTRKNATDADESGPVLSFRVPKLNPQNPAERESFRTTFQMGGKAYEALDWIAKQQGLSLKDAIALSLEFLTLFERKEKERFPSVVNLVKITEGTQLVRKSQVISRNCSRILKRISATLRIPRDRVMEIALLATRLTIEATQKRATENHAKAQQLIQELRDKAADLEVELQELLGDDDPVAYRFGFAIVILDNLDSAITSEISKGTPIDPEDMSQSC